MPNTELLTWPTESFVISSYCNFGNYVIERDRTCWKENLKNCTVAKNVRTIGHAKLNGTEANMVKRTSAALSALFIELAGKIYPTRTRLANTADLLFCGKNNMFFAKLSCPRSFRLRQTIYVLSGYDGQEQVMRIGWVLFDKICFSQSSHAHVASAFAKLFMFYPATADRNRLCG